MKPPAFEYRRPDSVEEALSVLAEHGSEAAVLAGGQSLVPLLNLRFSRPGVVVDINRLPGLDAVSILGSAEATQVEVGALVRARDLERNSAVAEVLPVVAEALHHVAHPQIRNRTTIGGNVSHADPSSELPAVLAALEGSVRLTSEARGERVVPWNEFFVSVFTTAKEPDELVTAVILPASTAWRFTFDEIARRQGDYPIAGLCSGARVVDGRFEEVRLAATAVADRPVRLALAETALAGVSINDHAAIAAAAEAGVEGWEPMEDLHGTADYRRALLRTLVARGMTELGRAA